jgi:hypothetical protein
VDTTALTYHEFRSSRWVVAFIVVIGGIFASAGIWMLVARSDVSMLERIMQALFAFVGLFAVLIGLGRITQRVVVSAHDVRIRGGVLNNLRIPWNELESWQLEYVDDSEGPHFYVALKRRGSKWSRHVVDNETSAPSFAEFVAAMRQFAPALELPPKAPPEKLSELNVPSTPKSPGSSC